MSGAGRKSQYRKHLTDSVLNDFPEPSPDLGTYLAKVVATRGGNQFDILLASSRVDQDEHDAIPGGTDLTVGQEMTASQDQRLPQLALLPTKFRKLVWIKRNDYVIVESGDASSTTGGGARYMIKHVLYKEQLKHLLKEGFWPLHDPEFPVATAAKIAAAPENEVSPTANGLSPRNADENGIDSNDDSGEDPYSADEQDDYLVNTNRRKFQNRRRHSDSGDSSSSDDS
jgi:probable RNA-binding protein EIF1AD